MTETEETNHPSPFDGPDVHEILQAFLDTDTQVLLKDTIARNTATVKSIDELFRTVEGKLESIDQKRSQIWMVFRRRYTRCVSKSRRIATDIGLAAEKYLNFIVRPAARYYEQGSISREDLEEFDFEVQDLLLENKRCMEEAETLESEFSNLQSEIKTFRDGLTAIEPSEEIDAPTQALAALKVELNSIRRNLATAKWAALFGGGIGIFGALLALTAWCPPVAGIVLAFGGAALLGSAGAAAYYKYKESRVEHKQEAVIQNTKSIHLDIETIINGLEFFRSIYGAITRDCQAIQTYLHDAQKRCQRMEQQNRATAPESLVHYLKSSTTLYYELSRALNYYAAGIDPI